MSQNQQAMHHSPRIQRIKDLIEYISLEYIESDPDTILTRTKLTKFLYLTDRAYHLEHGERFTGIQWVKYQYGPFSKVVIDAVNKLQDDDRFIEERRWVSAGRQFHYEPTARNRTTLINALGEDAAEVVKNIVKEHGATDGTDIVEMVKDFDEVQSIEKYEPITLPTETTA